MASQKQMKMILLLTMNIPFKDLNIYVLGHLYIKAMLVSWKIKETLILIPVEAGIWESFAWMIFLFYNFKIKFYIYMK